LGFGFSFAKYKNGCMEQQRCYLWFSRQNSAWENAPCVSLLVVLCKDSSVFPIIEEYVFRIAAFTVDVMEEVMLRKIPVFFDGLF